MAHKQLESWQTLIQVKCKHTQRERKRNTASLCVRGCACVCVCLVLRLHSTRTLYQHEIESAFSLVASLWSTNFCFDKLSLSLCVNENIKHLPYYQNVSWERQRHYLWMAPKASLSSIHRPKIYTNTSINDFSMKNQSSANDQNSWLQNDTRSRAQSVGERERERMQLGWETFTTLPCNHLVWKILIVSVEKSLATFSMI